MGVRGAGPWTVFHCLARPLSRELGQERDSQDCSTCSDMGCWHLARSNLNHGTTVPILHPDLAQPDGTPTVSHTLQLPPRGGWARALPSAQDSLASGDWGDAQHFVSHFILGKHGRAQNSRET